MCPKQKKGTIYMLNDSTTFRNINFNGGSLSSDGGAILMLQFLKKINLKKQFGNLPFHDERMVPVYSNYSIFEQLVGRTLLGYFNQSDQKVLLNDPLLSQYFDACSQPTVSRFFDRVVNKTNVVLKEDITRQACTYVNDHVDDPIIDADSTLVTTNGNQEAAAFIHHYSEVGYHPIVINEFNSKLLLSALLRTGSSYSANGIIEELKTIMPYLKNNGNIRFRGDSAFYDTDLLGYLEENSIQYYIRAKSFRSLIREAIENYSLTDEDWYSYTYDHPYYGEMRYKIAGSSKDRRVVYKAYWVSEDGQLSLLPIVYAVVTNDETSTPKEVMNFYEARGSSENFTKELKDDFDAGTLSHHNFYENEMEFLISCLSYNLFHLFQNTVLLAEDKKIRMNTFRMKFQKIAVKVINHARRITLSFSSAYKNQMQFMKYWNLVLQI